MDWTQVLTIVMSNFALFLWARSEGRSDMREMRGEMNTFKGEIRSWKEEINKEMKDFHGRLCAIEERNKKN